MKFDFNYFNIIDVCNRDVYNHAGGSRRAPPSGTSPNARTSEATSDDDDNGYTEDFIWAFDVLRDHS